jgi:integration host factor subunit alpha
VEQLFDIMKKTIENGEDLLISGFGKFMVKEKAARRGRNPKTSEELQLRARRIVTFKASGALRQKINAGSSPAASLRELE